MPPKIISIALLILSGTVAVAATAGSPAAVVEVSKFSAVQLEYVQGWIHRKIPNCPLDVSARAAEKFLDELQSRYPYKLDSLLTTETPSRELESALLHHVGAQLTTPAMQSLREELARRRLELLLGSAAGAAAAGTKDVAALTSKIKEMSPAYYRRLVEGRMEDDDVILLMKKATQPVGAAVTAPAKPKVLTASDIVSEFARHSQEGSAMQHLRAYTVEGRLKSADGAEQHIFLYKMRPNRFRLVVQTEGTTRFIMGFDGEHYWEQASGEAAHELRRDAVGARRYLGEFSDPLFGENGATFERLPDGGPDGGKFLRIAIRRSDGSQYVAQIDPVTYLQIGRENDDKSIAHYSDFRETGGITNPFREEITDATGRKGLFELTRYTSNPGLMQAFFEPAPAGKPDYFDLERIYAKTAFPAAK